MLITRQEVEKMLCLGRSTIYRGMQEGWFPLPIRIGPRAVRWKLSEIEAWLATRPIAERGGA